MYSKPPPTARVADVSTAHSSFDHRHSRRIGPTSMGVACRKTFCLSRELAPGAKAPFPENPFSAPLGALRLLGAGRESKPCPSRVFPRFPPRPPLRSIQKTVL